MSDNDRDALFLVASAFILGVPYEFKTYGGFRNSESNRLQIITVETGWETIAWWTNGYLNFNLGRVHLPLEITVPIINFLLEYVEADQSLYLSVQRQHNSDGYLYMGDLPLVPQNRTRQIPLEQEWAKEFVPEEMIDYFPSELDEEDEWTDPVKANDIEVYYMVWNTARDLPLVYHDNYEDAVAEAERISRKHPEERVQVLATCAEFVSELNTTVKEVQANTSIG